MTVFVRERRDRGYIEYDIRILWPDGEEHRERRRSPVSGKSATERWAREREQILLQRGKDERQEAARAPKLGDLWKEYIAACRVRRNAESTIEWKQIIYGAHIRERLGPDTRVDAIDSKRISALMSELAGQAPKSVNNVLGVLAGALRWAHRQGKLARLPPIEPVKVPESPPRSFDRSLYERLLAGADELERDGAWEPAVMLLLGADCGLRRGEMLGLHQADLNHEAKTIVIQHAWSKGHIVTTKGKRFRVVGMSTELARRLRVRRHLRGPLLFYGARGQPATPHVLYRWFDLLCARSKLSPDGKLHALRHTFGSDLAMAGVDLHRIQALLGHTDQRTTQIYARLAAAAALTATGELANYRARAGNPGGAVEPAIAKRLKNKG